MARILIAGGYGAFGSRVAERLARETGLELIIAGRNRESARHAAATLRAAAFATAHISDAALDVTNANAETLQNLQADIVINASGPFQGQNYGLARAAIAARCHYIDLADARGFVTGITDLDDEANAAGVLVVSGASSVPGLSSAVVSHYAGQFERLERLEIGISPGNSFDPGVATTASILSYVGQPFCMRLDERWKTVHGWQGLTRHNFAGLGRRWMGYADVPDLDLFPEHIQSLKTVRFQAGLEVGLFHLGLWGLSWLVRAGLVSHLARYAPDLLAAKRRLSFLGTDAGGMFVALEGYDAQSRSKRLQWSLTARSGHGPYVPAIAPVILARRLARGQLPRTGATPCFGLFRLSEFETEAADLDIAFTTE